MYTSTPPSHGTTDSPDGTHFIDKYNEDTSLENSTCTTISLVHDDSDEHPMESNAIEEEHTLLVNAKVNIMNRRAYMAGNFVLMEIEVLRHQYKTKDVFTACLEAG